jgi:hypothetical protein
MHTGSIDGQTAIIGLLPEQNVGVYVLGNLDHAELRHALMYQVFDLYGTGPKRDWSADLKKLFDARRSANAAPARATGTKPSLALEKYAGTYSDSAYGAINVTLANGTLRARFEKADLGPLEHWQYDTFRGKTPLGEDGVQFTFVPDGAGAIGSVRAYGTSFVRARR